MPKERQAVVVGAGIIGVTTAEMLLRRGYAVTIVDAARAEAMGASHANAGQLCYPFSVALGNPGFLRGLPGALTSPDSGVDLSPWTMMRHPVWLASFLRNCSGARGGRNSRRILALAGCSAEAHRALTARHALEYDWRDTGKLWLAPSARSLAAAREGLEMRTGAGFEIGALSVEECHGVAPQLRAAAFDFAGGIYAPSSPVGDCRAFVSGLLARLREAGVEARFGVTVSGFRVRSGKAVGVDTTEGHFPADIVILANGLGAPALLPMRQRPAIAPLRGFSVTVPVRPGALDVSLTDPARAVALCRLGDRLRITGGAALAEAGEARPQAIKRLLDVARKWLPDAADYDAAPLETWCGARPTTPDSCPRIGPVGPRGVFINAGHGSLGWTLAAGSAEVLGKALDG